MVGKAVVQNRIDVDTEDRALPAEPVVGAAAHHAWFRAKVQEALDESRPVVAHDEVEAYFSKRRAVALLKTEKGGK
ncbi:hypothetical protein [Variovorax sp. UC122_21]|uniref:antitoxin PaaA2 family protein n=1 Tax=Variovorax sp. UC122_21 TaxID=3374554 RepID=UPI003757D7C8